MNETALFHVTGVNFFDDTIDGQQVQVGKIHVKADMDDRRGNAVGYITTAFDAPVELAKALVARKIKDTPMVLTIKMVVNPKGVRKQIVERADMPNAKPAQ